jgi:putative transposase
MKHNRRRRVRDVGWLDWFNTRRLLEPIGYVPPAEYEAAYYRGQQSRVMAA